MEDIQSLSHSKWRCQYYIVFAPKYRRKEIYGKLKEDIGKILRMLCEQKKVEIIEAEACPDHIHRAGADHAFHAWSWLEAPVTLRAHANRRDAE